MIYQDGVFYWENSPDYLALAVRCCFREGAYGSSVSRKLEYGHWIQLESGMEGVRIPNIAYAFFSIAQQFTSL